MKTKWIRARRRCARVSACLRCRRAAADAANVMSCLHSAKDVRAAIAQNQEFAEARRRAASAALRSSILQWRILQKGHGALCRSPEAAWRRSEELIWRGLSRQIAPSADDIRAARVRPPRARAARFVAGDFRGVIAPCVCVAARHGHGRHIASALKGWRPRPGLPWLSGPESERRPRIGRRRGQRPQKSRIRDIRRGFSGPGSRAGRRLPGPRAGPCQCRDAKWGSSALLLGARATIYTAASETGPAMVCSARRWGRGGRDGAPRLAPKSTLQKSWTANRMAERKPMHDDPGSEIIALDEQIHDLLIRRATLLRSLASRGWCGGGSGQIPLRPGEDAATVRRLVGRHRGDFPLRAVVRIWREILTASLSAQAQYPSMSMPAKMRSPSGIWRAPISAPPCR